MLQKQKIVQALTDLGKKKKRKFAQSVDLIINLRIFDVKKDSVNLFLELPYKIKEAKICAFLNKKSNLIDTITKDEFSEYESNKKKLKLLVKSYDFFISSANLMPTVARIFGRYLGQAGKMPSPQIGILKEETESEIKRTLNSFEKVVKIKSKEPSLKFSIGNENMKDEEIAENIMYAYEKILQALPLKKENIKSVLIKLTMTKPIKLM